MAYSENERDKTFNLICDELEKGYSLRSILRRENMPSSRTFFKWVDEDEKKVKQYERSVELRSEFLFDEIIEIADKQSEDVGEDENGNKVINHNIVQRNRLQIDARKWALSKMLPKKFGDKTDITSGGEKIQNMPTSIQVEINKANED
ncbi:terminase small subunit [Flavobacterium phage vB_FspS_snusmum6-1]|jgi:hypothetical protein|uniref:Terminase small subunit n=19 Tax=Caudoviricetes TaxID=2731619 RepID=A0A6B9LAU6_9CAUD|nr:terminase small subunit [Flavobacterium phage vB_FspS_filifjonk9-1]YP_009854706.1 terminase small subunit [Flavobacterium phage vB_FspS_hattifnatt9-1]YP_009854906.1 terminase small subunit [Flavobacterium phage vB_FspS_lillamy9-1]YP_009854979.1 terminase small subunit [Flavobacterium phage vB_FspS_morran9-1]YP_009855188.1 terminase small subunit [Flavobacterium phage vB_FspS_sniff9-1]YP_009855333.1 terminase small subunit [Flavobacterium phage vB_FspS_snusmum6-1]YP_009855400.1 terminase sm